LLGARDIYTYIRTYILLLSVHTIVLYCVSIIVNTLLIYIILSIKLYMIYNVKGMCQND